jgi:ribonuclease HI
LGSLILFVDGASRGNPGPSAYGALLLDEAGATLAELSESIGETTNNVAEYRGLIAGLTKALDFTPDFLTVKSDSLLLTQQLLLRFRVKDPKLLPLFDQAKALLKVFPRVEILHIPREQNRQADTLANNALDREAARGKLPGTSQL